ncbi:MAG TPA: rod-binding protein [Clostridiales bacterium]|nr:rod-binding protein [Clostridiales bacterium]HOL92619.1 rod-binding protein [Clostridiales bacterium]HPP35880.1 rod-binding protein [Clostridiales bacterium]
MDINMIDGMTIGNFVRNATNSATRASDDDFARRLEEAARNNDDRELKKACQEFEAIMLDMLYKQMKATIIKSDLVEEDPGRDIFESMLEEELMEQAAKRGSLGLADTLYKQLSRQYGTSASANTSKNTKNNGSSGEE